MPVFPLIGGGNGFGIGNNGWNHGGSGPQIGQFGAEAGADGTPFDPKSKVDTYDTIQDSYIPGSGTPGLGGNPGTIGYGIDLDRNGKFDNGRDGVLVFDSNNDGRYDTQDAQQTNLMMKVANGNFDLNGDGKVTSKERLIGKAAQEKYRGFDTDKDGKLSQSEIDAGGGKIWVDKPGAQEKYRSIEANELHGTSDVPMGGGRSGTLLWLDPFTRKAGFDTQAQQEPTDWGLA